MSSISNSNYYSVSSSTNKGMSGMISGMDTESMVTQMLSGTQSKIDKQEALKQQAIWRQEIYRDLITSINDFRGKYFDTSFDSQLATNFASPDLFGSMLSTIKSGDAVRIISTGSTANMGDMNVIVNQLASKASLQSDHRMSSDSIKGSALTEKLLENFDKTLALDVTVSGGEKKTIKINLGAANTEEGLAEAINKKLAEEGITDVSAKAFDGKMRLLAEGGSSVSVNSKESTSLALIATGLGNTISSDTSEGKMLEGSTQMTADAGYIFDMALDGVQKQITLNNVEVVRNEDGEIDIEATSKNLLDSLSREVELAFGESVKVELTDDKEFKFTLDVEGQAGHQLRITGANAGLLGITPGSSSTLSTSSTLSELGLAGGRFSFEINGEKFTFDENNTISDVMNAINNSRAGVKLSYSAFSDTFKLEANSSGSKYGIELVQTEGNLLSALFGEDKVKPASKAASSQLTVGTIAGKPDALKDYKTTKATMKINVNGKTYTYTASSGDDDKTIGGDTIVDSLNKWLKEQFGTVDGEEDGKQNIFYNSKTGELEIQDGYVVSFEQTAVDQENPDKLAEGMKTDLALALGFNKTATSNQVTDSTKIGDVIQLAEIAKAHGLNEDDPITAITGLTVGTLGLSTVKYEDGRLVLQRTDGGSGIANLANNPNIAKLFGVEADEDGKMEIKLGNGASDKIVGEDAKVVINGIETTRNSNTFEIDGITMELTKVSEKNDKGESVGSVISTYQDTDKIVDTFKSFVEDYNALIEKLNGYVDEKANYRDYQPLTSAQKKEMSDREIELWEEKAKQGLLRRDAATSALLSEMRIALYSKPAGSNIALYNIGIDTGNYKEKGKLHLDEVTLRNALTSNAEEISKLFTGEDGIASQMIKALKAAAETSSANPGSMVQTAGAVGWASENNNTLTNEIKSIEDRIKDLKAKYETERQRYWNQFNSMESILANYSSQSSYLSQMFTSY